MPPYKQLANGGLGDHTVDDHHNTWRYQYTQSAARLQTTGNDFLVITVFEHTWNSDNAKEKWWP